MINGTRGYHSGLVDLASGLISREIFVNDDIYAQEQERVFARSWLFVGHESQIPNPGDFFASRMGEESVILCRDRAGPPGSAAGLPLDAHQDRSLTGGVRKRRGLSLRRFGVRRLTGRGTGRYAGGGRLRTAPVDVR